MTKLGIVGSEGIKFTPQTEAIAKAIIRELIENENAGTVVSGACHLGGIDKWAADIGRELGLDVKEYPPEVHRWEDGYKPRNIKIAEASDIVYCITLKELPPTYSGMVFKMCYHCGTDQHVKSGGCWTVKYAKSIGRHAEVIVI